MTSFTLKQYGNSKKASCTYVLAWDYPDIVYTNAASKVSCKVTKWPKADAISYKFANTLFIGNFSAVVTVKITKAKYKTTIKTSLLGAVSTVGN